MNPEIIKIIRCHREHKSFSIVHILTSNGYQCLLETYFVLRPSITNYSCIMSAKMPTICAPKLNSPIMLFQDNEAGSSEIRTLCTLFKNNIKCVAMKRFDWKFCILIPLIVHTAWCYHSEIIRSFHIKFNLQIFLFSKQAHTILIKDSKLNQDITGIHVI